MLGNFVVQYSTNLAGTNWMNLLSLTNLPSSPYLFIDSGGVGQPARCHCSPQGPAGGAEGMKGAPLTALWRACQRFRPCLRQVLR
jgi:hypothetical protein